jgi:hypothetical protein
MDNCGRIVIFHYAIIHILWYVDALLCFIPKQHERLCENNVKDFENTEAIKLE